MARAEEYDDEDVEVDNDDEFDEVMKIVVGITYALSSCYW